MADILTQLQEAANAQKSFADRLREQRLARTGELNAFQNQVNTTNDFQTPGGVPLNPADVVNAKSLFAKSMQSALSPYSPELEQKALTSNADILSQIYQLQQTDREQSAKMGTGIKMITDPTTGEQTIDFSGISPDDALAIVNRDGRRLLSGGIGEKKSQAQAILQYGGVDKYLKEAPITDIYSLPAFSEQKKAQDAASSLLGMVDTAQSYFKPGAKMDIFGKGNLTGAIAGRKGFLRTGKQVSAQSALGEMSADKINKLSGAAVSPQEFERLKTFIPTATMQENEVSNLLDSMSRRIQMNMKVREDAIRSGQDAGSYWQKNKDQYLSEFGFGDEAGIPEIDIKGEVSKYWGTK